uniref:Uncharacterized protein n=1 Tax=Proboscia inermis TaxID=420281 RepID=A0A7S0CCP9_9STRA|mmetsp:Transcript_40416/g.41062  ORF Transcript_40416/g.41062 Transcript_40416/m.41062 type:complete len:113 (+) Transcript_40416:291-629(+)
MLCHHGGFDGGPLLTHAEGIKGSTGMVHEILEEGATYRQLTHKIEGLNTPGVLDRINIDCAVDKNDRSSMGRTIVWGMTSISYRRQDNAQRAIPAGDEWQALHVPGTPRNEE